MDNPKNSLSVDLENRIQYAIGSCTRAFDGYEYLVSLNIIEKETGDIMNFNIGNADSESLQKDLVLSMMHSVCTDLFTDEEKTDGNDQNSCQCAKDN